LAYVKDEGFNLQTCDQALKLVVSCGDLGIIEPFDSSCYGHVLSKLCQYATLDDKVTHGLHYPSIKYAQTNIQK
jgi:hypothetical protein